MPEREFRALAGDANQPLRDRVFSLLNVRAANTITHFKADGEIAPEVDGRFTPVLAGQEVVIFQGANPHGDGGFNEQVVSTMALLATAASGNAARVSVVMPYYFYSRADRPTPNRPVAMASVLRDIYAHLGVQSLQFLTIDMHAEATISSYFRWINLYASRVLVPKIKQLFDLDKTIFVAGDQGANTRTHKYHAMAHGVLPPMGLIKSRDPQTNKTRIEGIQGDINLLRGRKLVIIDDILASGETLEQGTQTLMAYHPDSVNWVVTHGFFADNAMEIINRCGVEHVLTTDTLVQRPEVCVNPHVKIVSVAPLLAEGIWRLVNNSPLDDLYLDLPSTDQFKPRFL